MKKYRQLIMIILSCGTSVLYAQNILNLNSAITEGLKNNFEILIEQNNAEIAGNNNTSGNAGMLPKVDLNASVAFANNATRQQFANGLSVDQNNVNSSNTTSGLYLSWTLFDGFRMFAAHNRLAELEKMGLLQSKIQIQNSVAEIIDSYYNVVRQKQVINGLREISKVSEERISIAQKRLDIGSGSKLDVLQGKIDFNAQAGELRRQESALRDVKAKLNRLIAREVSTDFDVEDSIPVSFEMNIGELQSSIQKNNLQLLHAQHNVLVAEHLVKEQRGAYYPRLNFNANYLFSRSENQAGFSLLNQNLGLNLGLTASWTIFNGFNTRNQVRNAQLYAMNAQMALKSNSLIIDQDLAAAYRKFLDDKEIVSLERQNLDLAKEALQIAVERYRIGSSSSMELREVQTSYAEALIRLTEAIYSAKTTETSLLKLNGNILR